MTLSWNHVLVIIESGSGLLPDKHQAITFKPKISAGNSHRSAGPRRRGRQLWRRTGNFLLIFLQFHVYDFNLRFKTWGPTTILTEFQTLPKIFVHIHISHFWWFVLYLYYRQVSNIRHTLVGNYIVDHSDVVGASPVGAAPTTSSFST